MLEISELRHGDIQTCCRTTCLTDKLEQAIYRQPVVGGLMASADQGGCQGSEVYASSSKSVLAKEIQWFTALALMTDQAAPMPTPSLLGPEDTVRQRATPLPW